MIGLSRLKRAIEDVPTGGMQTGDPKVRLKLCDAQRIEVEFNAIIAERDSALAQNAELVAMVEALKTEIDELKKLTIGLAERSGILASVSMQLKAFCQNLASGNIPEFHKAEAIRIALSYEDELIKKTLRDRDAEAGRAGFAAGCLQGQNYCSVMTNEQAAEIYAEKVRSGL